jgi:hypothetical protein
VATDSGGGGIEILLFRTLLYILRPRLKHYFMKTTSFLFLLFVCVFIYCCDSTASSNPFKTQAELWRETEASALNGAALDQPAFTSHSNGERVSILGALRRSMPLLNSANHNAKMRVVEILRSKGYDYDKEPVPDYILDRIKKQYPRKWQSYLAKY